MAQLSPSLFCQLPEKIVDFIIRTDQNREMKSTWKNARGKAYSRFFPATTFFFAAGCVFAGFANMLKIAPKLSQTLNLPYFQIIFNIFAKLIFVLKSKI